MRKNMENQMKSKRKRTSSHKNSAFLVKFLKQLSSLSSEEELRIKSISDVCRTLNDLQEIAAVCEKKQVSIVCEDDAFVISGRKNLSLAEALGIIIRARKIIVSAQTKIGLDKARKAGKRLGKAPGSTWKKKSGRKRTPKAKAGNS